LKYGGGSFIDLLGEVKLVLTGRIPYSDVAQDIVGWRALVTGQPAYPILAYGFREIGIQWNVWHASTHPPTAFLLVSPVAMLPWAQASMAWAWLMIGLLYASFRLLKVSWKLALGLTLLSLLWPPIITSLGQLTIIWLFGTALGYACLRKYPIGCGIGIGVASLPKFLPGLFVLLFLAEPRRKGWLGFGLVWSVALAALGLLSTTCLDEYYWVNQSNTVAMMLRRDNSGMIVAVRNSVGWVGVVCVAAWLAALVWRYRKDFWRQGDIVAAERLWVLFSYLSVALLPIAWPYSRVPLILALVYMVRSRHRGAIILAIMAVAIPVFFPVWGAKSIAPLVGMDLLVGLGLWLLYPTEAKGQSHGEDSISSARKAGELN
jgi:hypothetical protein